MDLSDSPVSGATVKVKDAGKSTVTDKDGNFSIPSKTGTIGSFSLESVQPDFAFISSGKIEIRTSNRTLASITGFNLNGKAVFKKERFVDAGVHIFSTPSLRHGVTLFKITADGKTALLKTCALGGAIQGKVHAKNSPVFSGISAKQATTAVQGFKDTIFVTKTGYLEYALRIDRQEISDLTVRIANKDLPVISQQVIFKPTHQNNHKPFRSCHAPSILELPDGTLLAVCFGGQHEGASDQKIYICRKEVGKEWTEPKAIAHGGGNPSLFRSFSGTLMRFDGWNGSVQTSTDEGKTWSTPRKTSGGGAEKNKPVQLEDGTILAANAGSVVVSTDDGKTWSKRSGGAKQGSILIYPNNRLQMLYRTGGGGSIGVLWSDDNGKSWSKGSCVLPNNNSGLDGTTLRGGTQVLAYNHSHRNQFGGKGRGILNLAISKDGKAWDAVVLVNYLPKKSYQYSYPGIIQSRNGLIHLVYTWHRRSIGHAVINPAAFKPVPMPNGKWPSSGPLSIEEWKRQNPDWDKIIIPEFGG
jgi:predicted neuraminidase